MKSMPPGVMNVAMKQAMNMTPEQREEVLKLGQQLFGSRKRRVTETPDEATLKEDKNIEFVSEEKKPSPNATKEGEENVIYVEPTPTATKEDKKKEKKEVSEKEKEEVKENEESESEKEAEAFTEEQKTYLDALVKAIEAKNVEEVRVRVYASFYE